MEKGQSGREHVQVGREPAAQIPSDSDPRAASSTYLPPYPNPQTHTSIYTVRQAQAQLVADGQHLTDLAKPRNDDDGTLYTRESLVLRYGLRRHPGIVNAVQVLWDFDGPRDDLGCLEKAGYVAFYLCVAKYLDSSFQMASAAATVEAEWEIDRKGCDALSFVMFFDSLFQLADLWVDSLDPADYVAFLDGITSSIFVLDERGRRRLKECTDIKCIQQGSDNSDSDDDRDTPLQSKSTKAKANQRPTQISVQVDIPKKHPRRVPPLATTLNKSNPMATKANYTSPTPASSSKRQAGGGSSSTSASSKRTTSKRPAPTSQAKPRTTKATDAPLALVAPEKLRSARDIIIMPLTPSPTPDDSSTTPNDPNSNDAPAEAPSSAVHAAANSHQNQLSTTSSSHQPDIIDEEEGDDQTLDDETATDKHAIAVRLVRFASAHQVLTQSSRQPRHTSLNDRGHFKIHQLTQQPTPDSLRVGRQSFMQSAMPQGTSAATEGAPDQLAQGKRREPGVDEGEATTPRP
ncbi:hypothetical protein AaE_006042 [Aphanomyces astaci]|uniref:Uncharacterized protein n=2 Tax=Aphanomyces astaci TaxID=112090 RepID=A0A6A5AGM3_APHAT|nr:hypothetical protein AaE_006042 [Aphanomyces astaci]